jgi:hypothetical protein
MFLFLPTISWIAPKSLWLWLVSPSSNKVGYLSIVPHPQSQEISMPPLQEVGSSLWPHSQRLVPFSILPTTRQK